MQQKNGMLVERAKELGIEPNPNMSSAEIKEAFDKIKMSFVNRSSDWLAKYNINDIAYYHKKHGVAEDRKNASSEYKKNYEEFVNTASKNGCSQRDAFWWHDFTTETDSIVERFVVDVDIASPHFIDTMKKLDAFCEKYEAAYKIPNPESANRSDTMNIYMTQSITPEMAAEVVDIVQPCLNETLHKYLDGQPLLKNGQEIKGIKIAPEPVLNGELKKELETHKQYETNMKKDLGEQFYSALDSAFEFKSGGLNMVFHNASFYCSFGQRTAAMEAIELAYYLGGQEDKSPVLIQFQDGQPYTKLLDIDAKKDLSLQRRPLSERLAGLGERAQIEAPQLSDNEMRNDAQQVDSTAEQGMLGKTIKTLIESFSEVKQAGLQLVQEVFPCGARSHASFCNTHNLSNGMVPPPRIPNRMERAVTSFQDISRPEVKMPSIRHPLISVGGR